MIFGIICTQFPSSKTLALAQSISTCVESFRTAEEHMDLYARGNFDEYFDEIKNHNKPIGRGGTSPMAPLPFLSALFHGSIENALDIAFQPYPIKEKGIMFGTSTEAINSLAAIKKTVYDGKRYTLDEIYSACENNFSGEEHLVMKNILWNCPKWGNDDDYVDSIAKDVLEFGLQECTGYKTYFGGQILAEFINPIPFQRERRSWLLLKADMQELLPQ